MTDNKQVREIVEKEPDFFEEKERSAKRFKNKKKDKQKQRRRKIHSFEKGRQDDRYHLKQIAQEHNNGVKINGKDSGIGQAIPEDHGVVEGQLEGDRDTYL